MSNLVIRGGRRLEGGVSVEGNKNAALPLLAACLLTPETCELRNVPRIRDVTVMLELLRSLGAEVEGRGDAHGPRHVPASGRPSPTRRWSAACAGRCCCWARSSAGPARPGSLTRRRLSGPPHDYHPLARAWCDGRQDRRRRLGHVLEAPDGLRAASLYLLEASVTGTETALLGAALAKGVTEIHNAACEPRCGTGAVSRCHGRRRRGHRHVDGSHRGVASLHGATHVARRLHRGGFLGRCGRGHRR